ncbi:MAG: flavodoxin domain-containing protein [Archangium sp.]|nr:flavodoxin domain-containing protein [Archangium sp.]MDP3151939.1 flavodoxin domain-containing protein [Archangium sp.]MDP3571352.1 flavodoxin domain-containing protein [Archangium sp.]
MRVLVAYGTKKGGNEALARAVAQGLVEHGHAVDVLAANKVDALDRWDVVVVGGTPWAWFWHRNGQRFIKRSVEDLFQAQPPLIMRLIETAPQRVEVLPVEKPEWPTPTTPIPLQVVAGPAPVDPTRWVHRLVLWLCLFTGVTAVAGGVSLLLATRDLGYLIPGLILFGVVGVGNLAAAALEARRFPKSELVASVAGATLTGWSVMQLVMMRTLSWLQLVYFVVGVSTVCGAVFLWKSRHRLAAQRGSQDLHVAR